MKTKLQKIFTYQKKAARVIFVDRLAHVKPLMLDINALKVYQINMYPNLILLYEANTGAVGHCVESVQIRSFFWSVFSCIHYLVRIQENTDQKKHLFLRTPLDGCFYLMSFNTSFSVEVTFNNKVSK